MTDADLERVYRRWLRWYPKTFRREHEEEILAVLMAGATESRCRPELIECLDLMRGALWMHLRPRVPRSNRTAFNAVKLLYLGAVVELAATITIVATIGDVRSNIIERNPGLTEGQWHAVVAGQLAPTAVAAGIAVGFWLWMAWSIGRGHRWARLAFVPFFGLNMWGLFTGLAGGSAVYARPDLAIGIVLCLVELATVALLFQVKPAVSPSGAGRLTRGSRRREMGEEVRAPRGTQGPVRARGGLGGAPPMGMVRLLAAGVGSLGLRRCPVGGSMWTSVRGGGVVSDGDRMTLSAGKSGAPALSVDRLSKRFGDRMAFDDVSFAVGHGEVFGFLGPNGAGKTTTVRILGTLIAPTSGSATVAGISLTPENGMEIRRRIAIMPESPGLYLRLSVIENLECFADLYEVPDAPARIDRALRAVNLADRAHDTCGTLSKGLRQRVALARALLSDPQVLFLDEPTAGLDPAAARDVHELIDGLRLRGVTIFLTTHRLEEAERLCDRVAILNTTLRAIGRPDELRERLFARTLTVRIVAPLPEPDRVFGGLPSVAGWRLDGPAAYVLTVSDSVVAAPAVTRALVAARADVLSLGESRHSLEDVYLALISEDKEAGRA